MCRTCSRCLAFTDRDLQDRLSSIAKDLGIVVRTATNLKMSLVFNHRHLYYFWVVAKEGSMNRPGF